MFKKLICRSITTMAIIATSSINAMAQDLCAYTKRSGMPNIDTPAGPYGTATMGYTNIALCGRFSCPPYRLYQNNGVVNASATKNAAGYSIRYNRSFMSQVLNAFGERATAGIIAHELGHIIDFALRPGNVPQAEREATADRYAGCAFALAGAPVQNILPLAQTLNALGESPGYPTVEQRAQLLLIGYNQCSQ